MKILHDSDADVSVLKGKTVAVIGYGNQGSAQAQCMRDSGVKVIVGSIPDKFADKAREEGLEVMPIAEAAKKGDIVHILLPDEFHGPRESVQVVRDAFEVKLVGAALGFRNV